MIYSLESYSVMSKNLQPHGLYSPWNYPGQNTGMGSLSFLQVIFPTRGWTQLSLIVCRFFTAEPQGKSRNTELVSLSHFQQIISSVQWLSRVRLFVTAWITACQASMSITISWSSLRLTSIESVMPSSHLILGRQLLLLPQIPPSIRVFSNESTLRMRWPKYWSFSFSIIPSKEHQKWIKMKTQQPQNYGTQ